MKKSQIKIKIQIVLIGLIAAAVVTPLLLKADDAGANTPDTSASSSQDATPPAHKHAHHGAPFHGKLEGVNTNAMTLTVGGQTFQVTTRTRMTKKHEPVTLADAIIGERVSGYYRTNDDGSLVATSVRFGGHGKKKKEASEDSDTSTNNADSN